MELLSIDGDTLLVVLSHLRAAELSVVSQCCRRLRGLAEVSAKATAVLWAQREQSSLGHRRRRHDESWQQFLWVLERTSASGGGVQRSRLVAPRRRLRRAAHREDRIRLVKAADILLRLPMPQKVHRFDPNEGHFAKLNTHTHSPLAFARLCVCGLPVTLYKLSAKRTLRALRIQHVSGRSEP